jgi:hypothetical protein
MPSWAGSASAGGVSSGFHRFFAGISAGVLKTMRGGITGLSMRVVFDAAMEARIPLAL